MKPALFADAELAERLLRRSRAIYEATAKAVRQIDPSEREAFLDLGTTYAMFAGNGSPLTQATGSFEAEHLIEIDRFYANRATSWEAILTPFACGEALQRVLKRGANVEGWENSLYRPMTDLPPYEPPVGAEVARVTPDLMAEWSQVARRAFFGEEDNEMSLELSRVMEATPDTLRYMALWEGRPAAVATAMIGDRTAFLGGAATLPEFRGRGLQNALLIRRLHDAAQSADVATLGTVPGSGSQRNAERLGFRLAFSQLSLRVPVG